MEGDVNRLLRNFFHTEETLSRKLIEDRVPAPFVCEEALRERQFPALKFDRLTFDARARILPAGVLDQPYPCVPFGEGLRAE